jgi:hypothetical protein
MRPWLAARMPCFPQHAPVLARGLANQHGLGQSLPDNTPRDEALLQVGRELTLKTGLDCVQCHGIGTQSPRGDDQTQIALGINFADVGQRLQYDFFRRFVLDPPRFDLRTRMPKLSADGRTTPAKQYYDGDAQRQFLAIWHYIQQLHSDDNSHEAATQITSPTSGAAAEH